MRRGHGCYYLAASPAGEQQSDGIPQFFLPEKKITSSRNRTFLRQLVRDMSIDVVINQSGIDLPLIDLALSVRQQSVVISAHHGCVACLQKAHRSIVDHVFDRYHIPDWARPEIFYSFLKARSRSRTGRAFKLITSQCDRLVLLSQTFIPELEIFGDGIDLENVTAIPNPRPFDADPSAAREKENVAIFVGRLVNQQKRVDRLLLIWKQIESLHPDWRLEIIGDGPDRSWLEEMASRIGLLNVCFHGTRDPVPFYRKAKILFLTSDLEGFGMVLVEAQAFSCVPIASACSGAISEVIENHSTGLVVPSHDIDGYVDAMQELIGRSDGCIQRMASNALQARSRYSVETIADLWLELFDDLLERRKSK